MAGADFNTLTILRKEFAPIAKETQDFLTKIRDDLKEKEQTLLKNISTLMEKEISGHDVAQKIESMKMIDSLQEIHKALAVYQRLNAKVQIDIIPTISYAFSDAKSTLVMEKTAMANSEKLGRYLSTNTQRDSEVAFVFAKSIKLMSDIETINKSINTLIKFMDEQVSYLNKLDSSIRLKFNIKNSAQYLDESTAGVSSNMAVRSEDVEL